jgi:hypothetical protein
MENTINPVVGQWYRLPDADKGQLFQVIDVDADEDAIEVQYFDGDIEELPRDAWQARGFENCAPPEDWTGPYDGVKGDDLGYSDAEPLSERPATANGFAADVDDTREDAADGEAGEQRDT